MVKKAKKLGAFKPKKGVKYLVTDPENADRVLEVLGKKFVFKHDEIEKIEVSGAEAAALKEKYSYLSVAEL